MHKNAQILMLNFEKKIWNIASKPQFRYGRQMFLRFFLPRPHPISYSETLASLLNPSDARIQVKRGKREKINVSCSRLNWLLSVFERALNIRISYILTSYQSSRCTLIIIKVKFTFMTYRYSLPSNYYRRLTCWWLC